MTRIWRRC